MSAIYLIRHGRTALNAQGRFRGRGDPPLDEVGYEEALGTADALRRVGLVGVYTSPLTRARQTAEAIAAAAGVEVSVMPSLIDLDYGDWQGLTTEQVQASHPGSYERFKRRPLQLRIPGGESVERLSQRLLRWVAQIDRRHPAEPVAAVTHEIPLRVLLAEAAGNPARFWVEPIPTGSVFKVTLGRKDSLLRAMRYRNLA